MQLSFAEYFLEKSSEANGRAQPVLSDAARQELCRHTWRGNVRELKNILKRAAVMCESEVLDDFIAESLPQNETASRRRDKQAIKLTRLADAVEKVERDLFKATRAQCRNTRAMAAVLGVSHATVVRKMQKYGLNRAARIKK